MHPLPVPGSHEYVMRTAGSVEQSVAPETTASGSQGRLIFQSPHGHRTGQSTSVIPKSMLYVHLPKISNMVSVDVRRKRQILTCIWRNIKKGFIDTSVPTRHTRAAMAPTIYLPIP